MGPIDAHFFTGFDWLLLVLLAWSVFAGFKRGFVRALLGLIGLVGGCLLGSDYNRQFGRVLAAWIQPFATARIVAFLLIASAVWIVFALVGTTMKHKLKAIGLGMPDRLLGAGFGLARALLLGMGAMLAMSASGTNSTVMVGSRVAPYFLQGAREVSFLIPPDVQSLIQVHGYRAE